MTEKKPKSPDSDVATELENLRAGVKRLTEELAKVQASFPENIGDRVEDLRETAEDFVEGLSEKAQEGWNELQAQISENPVQSALVAFGLGFVLSRLLSR